MTSRIIYGIQKKKTQSARCMPWAIRLNITSAELEQAVHDWSSQTVSKWTSVAVRRNSRLRPKDSNRRRERRKGTKLGGGKPSRTETIRKVQQSSSFVRIRQVFIALAERHGDLGFLRHRIHHKKSPFLGFLFSYSPEAGARQRRRTREKGGIFFVGERRRFWCSLAFALVGGSGFQ